MGNTNSMIPPLFKSGGTWKLLPYVERRNKKLPVSQGQRGSLVLNTRVILENLPQIRGIERKTKPFEGPLQNPRAEEYFRKRTLNREIIAEIS